MSVPCPHCGSPLEPVASGDAAPADCPQCRQPLTPAAADIVAGSGIRTGPSFARTPAVRDGDAPRWPEWLVLLVLAAVLASQLLLSQRAEMAADPRWRPWIVGACRVVQCQVPPWREPEAYTMLARSVQPAAAQPGVLQVEASFRNDARWPQPWPRLLLRLSDIDGTAVGTRAFTPAEYGAANDTALAPGQSAAVRFEVVEPAADTVAFTFEFR